jgi:hypothetical protein
MVLTEAGRVTLVTVDPRLARIARNQGLFRAVNERIESLSARSGSDRERVEFLCECGRDACETRIWLTPREVESVHVESDRFALAPGHQTEEIERVVERNERYWVVDKLPHAEAIAREAES